MNDPADHARARIEGALTGCAVGDALGLAREGLSPARARRLLGELRHSFLLGRGVVSDDTDHSCLAALAVLRSGGDPAVFARAWARSLAFWLWSAPYGVGFATLRAGAKISVGVGPERSGVHSAGNGPAMRAPILGVVLASDPPRREEFVAVCSRASHTDPRAIDGAQLVAAGAAALATAEPGEVDASAWLAARREEAATDDLRAALETCEDALRRALSVPGCAAELGLERGVTGFVVHTVPVALYAAARHLADPPAAVREMIECGGDSDTTAAIVGALLGALHGPGCWPADWVEGVVAWPFTAGWRRELTAALVEAGWGPGRAAPGEDHPVGASPRAPFWGLPIRHLGSFPVILGHVLRRMLPPY